MVYEFLNKKSIKRYWHIGPSNHCERKILNPNEITQYSFVSNLPLIIGITGNWRKLLEMIYE